jgi:hypothetical protein
VSLAEGDTIARLVKRACAEFPHWGTADTLSLYLVAPEGDNIPSFSAMYSARLLEEVGWSLTRAGISSGAWLAVRKIPGCEYPSAPLVARIPTESVGGMPSFVSDVALL